VLDREEGDDVLKVATAEADLELADSITRRRQRTRSHSDAASAGRRRSTGQGCFLHFEPFAPADGTQVFFSIERKLPQAAICGNS
jgi:hypothetical protein